MHWQSRYSNLMICAALSLILATAVGCLPSPTKPLGNREEKKKTDDASAGDEKIGTLSGDQLEVPVFGPKAASETNDLPDPLLPPSDETVDSFVGASSEGNERLALSPPPKSGPAFEDQPLPSGLPNGLPDLPVSNPLPVGPLAGSATVDPLPVVSPISPLAKPTSPLVKPIAESDSKKLEALAETNPPELSPLAIVPSPLADNPAPAAVERATDVAADTLAPLALPLPTATLVEKQSPPPTPPAEPASDVPVVNIQNGPLATQQPTRAAIPPLIPRDKFFGRPERSQARISPDGKRIAFLANRNGVSNVFVAPIEELGLGQPMPVTNDRGQGVDSFLWAFTNSHILFLQDGDRDGTTNVFSVNIDTGETKNLTPMENVTAYVAAASHKSPGEILVAINDRPPYQLHDIHRANIITGKSELMEENTGFTGYEIDDDYRLRIAHRITADGGRTYATRTQPGAPWKDFLQANPDDAVNTGVVGFDKSGDRVYFVDSREQDLSVLKVIDLAATPHQEKRLAEHPNADVNGILLHPTEKNVQAVTFTYDRQKWEVLDKRIDDDLKYLHTVADGDLEITSRTLDDAMWTVLFRCDNAPDKYYLYRRDPRSTKLLFNGRPGLVDLPLAKMHSLSIPNRDGMNMVSYLSLPPGSDSLKEGRPDRPLPMVLLVHGGPWARDVWGYNGLHQLLANRGYAVLSVNFRGSTGFGKSFSNAGNREWAGKMHDDLLEGVRWAVTNGIAQENRIAIMGGGYGGYATLVGMTFTPDVFACGIDIVGPSNLVTLLENPVATLTPYAPTLSSRVGDLQTAEGREFLMSRSPSRFVGKIKSPLLIAQGGEDTSMTRAEADQIVQTMRSKGIPVTHMLFPDEGHGFRRDENRFGFYAVAEAFLAEHLGGRVQPIGSAIDNSSAQFPAGRDQIRDGLTSRDANGAPASVGQQDGPIDPGRPAAQTATLPLLELQPLPQLQ